MLLASPLSPSTLLSGSTALLVLAIILFAECGLLIGFFLPGDTLLFAAGISIATGTISTPLAAFLVVGPLAAIAGNLVGYAIGYRAGPVVFDRSALEDLPTRVRRACRTLLRALRLVDGDPRALRADRCARSPR